MFVTVISVANKKIVTTNEIVSNFARGVKAQRKVLKKQCVEYVLQMEFIESMECPTFIGSTTLQLSLLNF